MANPYRKASNAELIQANALGISLKKIGAMYGMHHSSVSERLLSLGIKPADTRRAFMDEALTGLTPEQLSWLSNQVSAEKCIKSFVRELIRERYIQSRE